MQVAGASSIVQPELNLRPVLRTSTDTHISHSCESLVVTFVQSNERIRRVHTMCETFQGKVVEAVRSPNWGTQRRKRHPSLFFFSSQREKPPERARTTKDAPIPPFCHEPWRLNTNCRCFLFPFVIYTRSGRIARDVQAGGDGQRQGLPTLVANGGGTDWRCGPCK